MPANHYRDLLARTFGGRRWIVAKDVLAGQKGTVDALRDLGAAAALCIAGSTGTGDLPDLEFAPDPILLDIEANDMMGGIRAALDAFANLPDEHVRRVDAFDPDHDALVIGTIFDDGRPVAGRRKFGARPAAWQALEDKVVIDQLWDEIGVERAPFEVVPATLDALTHAATRLDQGLGTVQSGDAREGFNGGATYLRWVRTPAHQDEAAAFFAAHCDRVRVMPFLEGIPCSIHGIVFDGATVALRPCEMLVFRRADSAFFHYGRAATFWDPPAADRTAMRQMTRDVGDHLRATLNYRGAFTIDGIMTRDGFRPTELNPRFGAALAMIATACPDLPLFFLNLAVVEGIEADWRPDELERLLLDAADTRRAGATLAVTDTLKVHEPQSLALVLDDDGFRPAMADESSDAHLRIGPAATGNFLTIAFDSGRTPIGPSLAPRAVEALRFADAHFGLDLGPLEPARDVR